MKARSTLLIVVLACCPVLVCAAEPSVRVRLAVEPSRVLAGIPASLHVVVTNAGDMPVVLPSRVLLRVIPSNGSAFLAEWGPSQEHRLSGAELPGDDDGRKVPAHEERTFVFTAHEFGHPGWFYDPRLNTPGTYRLQLLLGAYDENAILRARALEADRDVVGSLASTEAVLKVDTPTGQDAFLWNHLVALTRGKSTSWSPLYWSPAAAHDFASLASRYPASPYAAYAVAYFWSPSAEERLLALRGVLDSQPGTPVRESLQILVAETEATAAHDIAFAAKPDLNRANALYDRARADFEALERTTSDPELRARSRQGRERLPTAEELKESVEGQRN